MIRPRRHGPIGPRLTLTILAAFALGGDLKASPLTCLSAPYTHAETTADGSLASIVQAVREDLDGFPTLNAILGADGPDICSAASLVTEKAYYDPFRNRVVLANDLDNGLARAILVHEVRHIEQFRRGICPTDAMGMSAFARATLALEADASTVAVLVAWEQRDAGSDALWIALSSWDMTYDIADRFQQVMTESGDVVAAATAAFEQWYAADIRRERYYIANCSAYLDRKDATHALPTYQQLSDDFLRRVCVLPNGRSYDCTDEVRR